MSYGIVLVFDGVSAAQYWSVNEQLGIKPDGSGDWPTGLLSHSGGPSETGLVVSEVWSTKADQEAFMATRLGPALGVVGLPAPAQIIESEVEGFYKA